MKQPDIGLKVSELRLQKGLTAMHVSSMICIPIIPLLLWSWKKNQSYKIDQQGREVINFQITMALTLFGAAFLRKFNGNWFSHI